MSERIKALRTLYLLSPDELDEVFAHIDHLTAELARRQKQVESLLATCELVRSDLEVNAHGMGVTHSLRILNVALATTAEPGGEGGGR